MHIYDFITDIHQYQIKRNARTGTEESPFEAVLNYYYQLFMQQIDTLEATSTPKLLSKKLQTKEINEWFTDLLNIVKREKSSGRLDELFKDLLNIYYVFIDGKHQTAVSLMHYFLEKHDLLDEAYHEYLGSFLRVRPKGGADEHKDEGFYYHIPFNKRYLIKNQRFSFSGIPLLYAGQSLMASYFEIGATALNDDSYGVGLFGYNHLAYLEPNKDWESTPKRSRVYDITNSIYDLINDLFFEIIERGIPVKPISESFTFPEKTISRAFRKFILSQICTFPKKQQLNDQHFVEEYVLPQLLTEAVRLHKYDGILYPSTKFEGRKVEFATDWHSTIFKTNIALFTNHNRHGNYDLVLFKNFVPHVIDLSNAGTTNASDLLSKLENGIRDMENFLTEKTGESELRGRFFIQLRHLAKKIKLYKGLKIDGDEYLNTYAGKVEAMYLGEYFRLVVHSVHKVYASEYEAHFH